MFKRTPAAPTDRRGPVKAPGPANRLRIRLVLWGFIVLYAVVAGRLIQLQLDPGLRFTQEDLKHIGTAKILRPRGEIYDRTGRILATNRKVSSLSANPSEVEDPGALARFLSARLDLDRETILRRLEQTSANGNKKKFIWVKRWLDDASVAALGHLEQAPSGHALALRQETLRFYPERDLAAHVLGFSNRDGVGGEGLELAFDKYLRSEAGQRVSRVDSKRNFIGYLTLEYEAPTGGDDLHLTLDVSLQYTLERQLDAVMQPGRADAPRAMGLLMDAHTGAILALASRPAFDPNRYWEFEPEQRKNRAVVEVFEPGSAFKIVTASGALEHGLIAPDDLIDCENGRFNPYGHPIRDTHELGVVPFWQSFVESSNIAIIKVAALLGPERLESWITRYGFGRRTGIEVPGESPGIFRPLHRWSGLSMGALPMGQEVSVTMLQLAQAFAAIANGGYLVRPYLVDEAVNKEGELTYRHEAAAPVRVLSQETADTMKDLCYRVVSDPKGTGRHAVIPEYRVGGKTGTAQIALPNGGGYSKTKYTTVFAGFGPVGDPRVVCVIVVPAPRIRQHYGGYVCGPVFKAVVREALIRLNVPKDPMPEEQVLLASHSARWRPSRDADTVTPRVYFELLEPVDLERFGPRDELNLLPIRESDVDSGPRLPNFIGLSKRQAREKLAALDLPWDPQGAGRVVSQIPRAGTRLSDVGICKLFFSSASSKGSNDVS